MLDLPALPMRAGMLLLADLIDLYMAHYAGRDSTRVQRLTWWRTRVGQVALQDLTDDHVHAALEVLASRPAQYFAGRDATGRRVFEFKKRTLAPATVNRYGAALAAVITWSIKKRIAPKGFVHPCRSVERRPENNERTRFLSDDEIKRLLSACKVSSWPRLHALVLAAITTGARKGELLGLQWRHVDFGRREAYVASTKNGDPRVLPLVDSVIDELRGFVGKPDEYAFASQRDPTKAFDFVPRWHEAVKAARLRGVVFHTLRHTAASWLAKGGADLHAIAVVLGHRQLRMAMRYTHMASERKTELIHRVFGAMGTSGSPTQAEA